MTDQTAPTVEATTDTTAPEVKTVLTATDPVTTAPAAVTTDTSTKAEVVEDGKPKTEVQTDKGAKVEGVPEKYELVAPEGMEIDAAVLGKFEPVFKELNLSNESAQKLANLYAEMKAEEMKDFGVKLQEQVTSWEGELASDAEVGGKNFGDTVRHAQSAVARFGTPELKQFLARSGTGSHPELVRAFARIGKAMAEDSFITGPSSAAPEDKARRIFTTMNK